MKDTKKLVWFRNDPSLWIGSEYRLTFTLSERGLFMDIWHFCLFNGSVPADPESLIRVLSCSPEEFEAAWPKVSAHFPPDPEDPTRLVSRSASRLRCEAMDIREARSDSGAKGGKSHHQYGSGTDDGPVQ